MTWEPMTIDECAALQRASGAEVVKIQDTWWREARPFFFRPLFPFARISPQFRNYPLKSVIGGVLHPVPEGSSSNCSMNLFLYDELQSYSIDNLTAKQRWTIRKGLKNFRVGRITDLKEFVEEAYTVYESFYDRTRYFYKKERRKKEAFAAWARPFFDQPKIAVIGAYHRDKLCAIDISYQVEDTILDDVFFSDTESQSLRVTDFMLHILREEAKSSDARVLFRGFPAGKQSLDRSKVTRGCKILKLPAYCRINPLALAVGKAFMNQSYQKLTAMTSFADMIHGERLTVTDEPPHPETR